jgi:hypothetical protein
VVHLPGVAGVRTILDDNGDEQVLPPDVRALGPVYLGLYASVSPPDVTERYAYPEIGPQFLQGVPGDAYPYGGTTIGDLRFACIQDLACKVVSGRFSDYQELVDWYDLMNVEMRDNNDDILATGEQLRQTCYDLFSVSTDLEVRILASEDRNDDGQIDNKDLDFIYDADADEFVGEFTIWQQELFYDENDTSCVPGETCKGMELWGWMDTPSSGSYQFKTCDGTLGYSFANYNQTNLIGGRVFPNVLNFPTLYVEPGDYAASGGFEWKRAYDVPDFYLDDLVE